MFPAALTAPRLTVQVNDGETTREWEGYQIPKALHCRNNINKNLYLVCIRPLVFPLPFHTLNLYLFLPL